MCSGECFEMMFRTNGFECNIYFSNISIPYRVLKSTSNIHLLMCTMGFRFNVGCSMFLVRGNVSRIISLGIHSCPMLSCILWIFYFPMTTLWNWGTAETSVWVERSPPNLQFTLAKFHWKKCLSMNRPTGWFCLQLIPRYCHVYISEKEKDTNIYVIFLTGGKKLRC